MPTTVDTSIYNNLAQPKPPGALDMLGSAANTINALNQNRLFGQTFGARQAIGQAYQQATDPNPGVLDSNKLNALVSQDPRASFMAGEVNQQALERQKAQIGIQTDQLNLGLTHAKAMGGFFAQMAAKPDLSMKDVTNNATEMVAQGLISPQEAAAEAANIPSDQAGLHQWALGHAQRYAAIQGTLEQYLPKPTIINNGPKQMIADTNPLTNPGVVGAQVPNQLTAQDLSAPVTVYDPVTKQNKTVTKAQFLAQTGGGGLSPQMGAPGADAAPQAPPQPSQAPQAAALGTGRMPAPAAQAQPAMPGLPSSPPLGAAEAASVTAQNSAKQGIDLQANADTVPAQKALLGNLESALNQFTAGPGADWKKVAKAFVNQNTESAFGKDVFDPKTISSQEEFGKQSFQLAQQQFQALGGTGTDSKLDSTMHTSPNDFLSKLGNQGIIHLLKGNADAIAVKNQEWQNWLAQGHGSETYGQFSTAFNKSFDPRVFQSQYMSPTERQDILKGLTTAEKNTFRKDYNTAVTKGWIPDPRAQNAPGQ